MTITKKQFIFGTLTILGLLAIGLASVFAIQTYMKSDHEANKSDHNNTESTKAVTSESDATSSLAEAKKAREAHDFSKAIATYRNARTYYTSTGNTDKVAEIDITLSLVESEQKHFVPQPKPTLAGEK